jgi:hypothetical protein
MIAGLWRRRWNLLRLSAAVALVWLFAGAWQEHRARLELAALPDVDLAAEAEALLARGRGAEALTLVRAGLEHAEEAARGESLLVAPDQVNAQRVRALRDLERRIEAERASWARRAADAGRGALTGRGDSLEALAGAVTADLFVVGDLRDLAIQGARLTLDGEADPVITALSALGLATTFLPGADAGASFLKAAHRHGALPPGVQESIIRAGRQAAAGNTGALAAIAGDSARLARSAGPATALRAVRHAADPGDLSRLAGFAERAGNRGAAALHIAPARTLDTLRAAPRHAPESLDAPLKAAAIKGEAGFAWLKAQGPTLAARACRPHPLLGLTKALWKGNAQALATRLAAELSGSLWWLLPLAIGWCAVECVRLCRASPGRWNRTAQPSSPSTAAATATV